MDYVRHPFYHEECFPWNMKTQRDGPRAAVRTCQSKTADAKKHAWSVYRKGSLGYALEEHRSELKKSPLGVIEFLSRSWSSSSMRAFEMIAQSLDYELQLQDEAENREEMNCKQTLPPINGDVPTPTQSCPWTQQSICRLRQRLVDMAREKQVQIRKWMREKTWWSHENNKKRKEEQRLQATVSVAGLAAAIAAFSAKSAGDTPDKKKLATAAAAALVAVQCAEMAELMGAQHQHVAYMIDAAIAVATPDDILALTAAAATSLRGATTGRRRHHKETKMYQNRILTRSSKDSDFARNKRILARGTELPTCITNGKTQLKIVHVFDKQSVIILRVRTKHLGGVFTTFKDYAIMEVVDESKGTGAEALFTNEVNGYCCICIRTCRGDVHITFKDDIECGLWTGTISHLLLSAKQAHLSHVSINPGPSKYSFRTCFYLSATGFL